MNVVELLLELRPAWIRRVANSMARGAETREQFQVQLEHFYDLLTQAIITGDPAWIDPALYDWANAPTQTALQEGEKNLSALLNRMILTYYELAREDLSPPDALETLGVVLPVFTYALEKAARYEMEKRVAYISDELIQVQKQMERLDQSKSTFISVAAHELKTPLTLIEGYAAMISDSLGNNHQMDALLEGINSGIRRLRAIIDDLIDVSLIDNNLLTLNFQPTWLSHIFDLIASEEREVLTQRHLTLVIEPFDGINTPFLADTERLYQAIHNIVLNAIKYTPDGGNITISGRLLPGFVEVTIADTGIGIDPENQEIIFGKFSQLGNTLLHSSGKTKFKGGGPGLGLPIARGIIEAHGGTIWVESEGYDEERCPGSTFHILLPLRSETTESTLARLFNRREE
ncbi:MAG: HAMP domain-containing histidine kinase [Anaerolineales bacterium]|nr:HAMP domain-containing histidine kinase [Anaerolineales bacterium]MCX7609209.1 HAMP domain-containing histidine kinase [Anaerolineales bacterium]MDW8227800.1 HAMP domain-containing sensor histidine kinase [Anaerolineales bacterium]